jgi:glutathione S-transferase
MSKPVLYHLEISHYNEKARWALDYKRIPHERKTPPPMLHTVWALAMTGKPTFPVLRLNGRSIGDSTRIIEALEREYPEPALYPADSADRRRALELEDFFDEELGPYIRRWLFHEGLVGLEPGQFIEGAMGNAPGPVKTFFRVSSPVSTRVLRLRYGINEEDAQKARAKTEAAIDRLEDEIQPSGYLAGDSFSVADLSAAALLFPLVRPPEAPHRFEGPQPEGFQRLRDSVEDRPGFKWVQDIYREHRSASAAVPA